MTATIHGLTLVQAAQEILRLRGALLRISKTDVMVNGARLRLEQCVRIARGALGMKGGASYDRVMLRRWRRSPHTIIALLPDCETNPGRIIFYECQHGETDISVMSLTYACNPTDLDAEQMLVELRSIGYNPRIIKRLDGRLV